MTPNPELHPKAGTIEDDVDHVDWDESTLIELAKVDKDAFGDLYEIHFDGIYNFVYYRVGNRHDAEDLTARVFFKAMQHLRTYEYKGVPFSAWLYRIARNLLANWFRDTSRRQFVSLEGNLRDKAIKRPEVVTELAEDKASLLAAVRRLPPERQELLIFKYVQRLSNREIGQIMGRSEGAIKSLYYRTLVSLRDDLRNHGLNVPESQP